MKFYDKKENRKNIVTNYIEPLNGKDIIAVVHDGVFHADDVLCIALLKYIYEPDNATITVVRTRADLNVWKKGAQFVLDIGGEDKITDTQVFFDHHQKESEYQENGIKKCAASKLFDWMFEGQRDLLRELHRNLLDPISAFDNGQDKEKLNVKVLDSPLTWVRFFVPGWEDSSAKTLNQKFNEAVDIALKILVDIMNNIYSRLNGFAKVRHVINTQKDRGLIAENGFLVLDKFAPWQEEVSRFNYFHRDHESNEDRKIIFVVFKSTDKDTWMLQTVPKAIGGFSSIQNLPKDWLDKNIVRSKYPSCVFVHTALFLAVFNEKKDALMAAKELSDLYYADFKPIVKEEDNNKEVESSEQ